MRRIDRSFVRVLDPSLDRADPGLGRARRESLHDRPEQARRLGPAHDRPEQGGSERRRSGSLQVPVLSF
jgi:hypothetical protein